MSELITKLNPVLVMEAMQAPAIIYEKDSIEQLHEDIYKRHTYDPSTRIGVIILNDSEISREMFAQSSVRKVQLLNITSIGDKAFEDCKSLTSVTIPDNVTSIGDMAFWKCHSLTNVTIPDSVTSIGSGAFNYCTSLTSVTIGNGVTAIGDRAFEGCDSLTSVTIGNSVSEIGQDAFLGCTGKLIVNCNLPFASFPDSNFSHVVISNGVTSIGHSAFSDCRSLTSVTIPDSVTEIEHSAFQGCSSLTSVTIPNGITEIGSYTFRECTSLKSITIPNGVTEIGYSAFRYCSSLKEVYCKPTTPPSGDEDMFPYYDSGSKPLGCKIYVPLNSVEAYKTSPYWSDYADQIVGVVFEDEALESGTNIKTINGNSILGSGDITIEVGSAVTSININGQSKLPSSGVVDLGYVNKQLSTTTSSSMTLSPNVYYRNTSTSLSTLTITLGGTTNNDIINEYFVEFTTRSAGTTVSLPSSIKWANGVTPTFENGKTYQISIVNNLGTCVKFG